MATKLVKLTGGDYSTMAAYASYLNALALSAPEVCEVGDGGAIVDTAEVTFGGWTGGSGTNTVTFRPATGAGFGSHASKLTNALRWNASNGAALSGGAGYQPGYTFTGTHVIIDGLQIRTTATSSNHTLKVTDNTTVRNCIIYGGMEANRRVLLADGATITLQNLLVVLTNNSGSRGVDISGVSVTFDGGIVAATNSSAGDGIRVSYASNPITIRNVAVYGFSTTDFSGSTSSGSTNNATSNASFSSGSYSTSGQTSIVGATEFESVTAGSEDFRLKSTSAKLKDNGATVGLTADIVGTTRTAPYDIGVWELVSGSAFNVVAAAAIGIAGTGAVSGNIGWVQNVAASAAVAVAGAIAVSGDVQFEIKKWRVPTTAPATTAVHVTIMSGTSPTYTIVTQATAVVDADGYAEIPATGTVGTKRLAHVHNFDDDTETDSIYGGPGIAELVDVG